MLSLTGYASSDDEDNKTQAQAPEVDSIAAEVKSDKALEKSPTISSVKNHASAQSDQMKSNSSSNSRPSLGPSLLPEFNTIGEETSSSLSRYTSIRTSVRELTMPPIPNLNIPSSPPGSPPFESTKKFAKFLDLKKEGIHFNSKLESSSAIRNPGVLPKLLEFAGIDHYDQYASALPDDLATLTSYPPWAYGEELNKSQQRILKKKEEKVKGGRGKIDFVAGSNARSSQSPHASAKSGRPPSPKRRR